MDEGYSYLWIIFGAMACLGAAGLAFRYWRARQENVTEEDIKTMVNEGHEQGVLETREAKMIRSGGGCTGHTWRKQTHFCSTT